MRQARTLSIKPKLRADQIGSLLRPQKLKDAREAHEAGRLSTAELRMIENTCISEAVQLQEAAGLHAISDGDFRRSAFHVDFLTKIEGIVWRRRQFTTMFHGLEKDNSPLVFEVTHPIRHNRDIAVEDFNFLSTVTKRTAKVALPAPSFVHARGGRDAIEPTVYPDLAEFYEDLAAAFRAEIAALANAGCRYVQLDEVHYTFFCDPKLVAMFTSRGDDPADLALKYAKLINDSFRDQPDMISGVHLCRGNLRSRWLAAGSYEAVAERLFNETRVDAFFLEYDTPRAGDFAPLRFMAKDKTVVLGLVSTKTPVLEDAEALRRRIDEAARHVPLERLALSPQCGFASTVGGNLLSIDDERRKLGLVVEVAQRIWGQE